MSNKKIIKCPECKRTIVSCAKGLCRACYQRVAAPKVICSICKRNMPHHAKGMCKACYNKKFHYRRIQESNIRRDHSISLEDWQKITKNCIICGFDKIIDLHHLDENKGNNSLKNLIGLCPNHHKMVHSKEFREETLATLQKVLIR